MSRLNNARFRLITGFVLLALALAIVPAASHALAGTPAAGTSGKQVARHGSAVQGQAKPQANPHSQTFPAAKYVMPDTPVDFRLDDGSAENSIGFGNSTDEDPSIWLNRFTPYAPRYPITIQTIQIYWPAQTTGTIVGLPVKLLVYIDTDGNGDPSNATKLAEIDSTVGVTNSFQTYNVSVAVAGPGDIYVGFEDFWAEASHQPKFYPAALDSSSGTQNRSFLAAMGSGANPDRNNLGNNDLIGTIENVSGNSISGNWLIRATGDGSGANTETITPTSTPSPTPPCSLGGWVSRAPMPTSLVRAAGVWFATNSKFYAMGGRSSDSVGSDQQNPRFYDPSSGTWTIDTAASFPDNQVNNMVCADLTGPSGPRIYCVGGSAAGQSVATSRLAIYDPVGHTFTTGTAWPGMSPLAHTPLPGGRAVVSNKLYILGGFDPAGSMTREIWQLDPAVGGGTWTLKTGQVPDPVAGSNGMGYIPSAAIGTTVYAGGGTVWTGATIADNPTAFTYDTVADAVATITPFPAPGTGETRGLNVNNKLWVIGGGRTAPNPSGNVMQYDPANPGAGWTLVNSFDAAGSGRRNFPVDIDPATGRIFLAGGYQPTTPVNTLKVYDLSVAICTPTVGPTNTLTPTNTSSPTPTTSPTPICPGSWTQQAQYPAHVMDQAAAVQGTKLYSFSGVVSGTIQALSYAYDSVANTWSAIAPLPSARENASAVSDGTFVYILGGNNSAGTVTSSLWRYDPTANTYITLTNYTTATRGQAAAYLNNKIYKIGGLDTSGAETTAVEEYDIATGIWTTKAGLPTALAFQMAIAINPYVYTAGGENGTGGVVTTYRFDPIANVWNDAAIADLPGTRWGAASDVWQGKWLIAGGFAPVNDDITQGALTWDPGTNTWTQIDSMLQPRARLGGGAIGSSFYAVGGATPPFSFTGSTDNQRYNLAPCSGSIITGHLTWQGIPQPNSRNTLVTGTLTICTGGTANNYIFHTDASGNFTVTTTVPNGGPDTWVIKGPRHIATRGSVTISGGVGNIGEAGLQKGGDTVTAGTNNNIINASDFNFLKSNFGQAGDRPSDIDFNGVTNSSDFNILKGNFGQAGAALTCP